MIEIPLYRHTYDALELRRFDLALREATTAIERVSTVTKVNRSSTFALRHFTLDFCLGGQRVGKQRKRPKL